MGSETQTEAETPKALGKQPKESNEPPLKPQFPLASCVQILNKSQFCLIEQESQGESVLQIEAVKANLQPD